MYQIEHFLGISNLGRKNKFKVFKIKFKLFSHRLASQLASQWAWAHGGPDPGPMGQGHGPGPGPMDRAIISEAANAADFKGGCGGAEPPRMIKVQLFSGCPGNPGTEA